MTDILLLGTHHKDELLEQRLLRALYVERPTAITVEAPVNIEEIAAEIEEKNKDLREKLEKKGLNLREFFRSPKEETVVTTYCTDQGIPYFRIDAQSCAQKMFEETVFALSILNMICKTREDFFKGRKDEDQQKIEKTYAQIQLAMEGKMSLQKSIVNKSRQGLGERDATPARALTQLSTQYERIVHVCGALHILDDKKGETLYERIKHLHPRRATIRQYE